MQIVRQLLYNQLVATPITGIGHGSTEKKVGVSMNMSKSHAISVITLLLFGGVLFSSAVKPASAQTSQPTSTPTPNPTITVLEEQIKALEADVKLLDERKDLESETLKLQTEKQLLPIYVGGVILGALGLSTAIGSWAAYKNFTEKTRKDLEEKTRQTLNQAFYNADPLYYPLYVPMNGFEVETKRLRKLGFRNLFKYGGLRAAILNGVVIIRIPGENFNNNEDLTHANTALGTLEEFIIENDTDNKPVAFVLYITGGGHLPKATELVRKYDNIAIANMPVTVAGHVYALVRGLTTIETKKEDA